MYDGTYRVILRIVKAGCHPVAIAQVVEHLMTKVRGLVQSRVAAGFSQLSKNIPKPFLMYMYIVHHEQWEVLKTWSEASGGGFY